MNCINRINRIMNSSNKLESPSMNKISQRVGVLAASLLAVAAVGCGEAVDINRVGPNAIEKTILSGEWYYRSTVVDKQFHTSEQFIGVEGSMDRIRWEITEFELIATRTYERIPGTDAANPGGQSVLAVFPIVKHFDIRRQYNPVNGVENNVIEENDYDRPWWERDHVRVDWSTNMASGFDPFFFGNWIATYGFDPARGGNGFVKIDDADPTYQWRTRISEDYIETTLDSQAFPDWWVCSMLDPWNNCSGAQVKVKMSFMKLPEQNDYVPLDYPDFKTVRTAYLVRTDQLDGNGNPMPILTSTTDFDIDPVQRMCTGDEVGVDGKGQFLVREIEGLGTRICNPEPPPLGDGEENCRTITALCDDGDFSVDGYVGGSLAPLFIAQGPEDVGFDCDVNVNDPDDCFEFTTPLFSRFGYFRTDRFIIDREQGGTVTGRERLINRWNMWERIKNDNGTIIPMRDRTPKPIVYHTNALFPTELKEANKQMELNWDQAFRGAVAAAQGIRASDVPQMFFIKENDCNIKNVEKFAKDNGYTDELSANGIMDVKYGNLETACAVVEFYSKRAQLSDPAAPVFTWQQLGDLRYSFVNWTPKAEMAGPLGYGPSASDPLTGQIISANANVYGTSVDTYSNWGADVVQLINGELTTDDIVNGTHIRKHIEAVRDRWRAPLPADQVDGFRRVFDQRTEQFGPDEYLKQIPVTAINSNWDRLAESGIEESELMDMETVLLFGGRSPAGTNQVTDDMMAAARPSSWSRTRIPDEAMQGLGGPDLEPDRQALMNAAPRSRPAGSPLDQEELSDYLGRRNMCFLAAQVEPAVADLAREIADAGLTREEMVKVIRERIYVGVMAHELGHTFGLRHNFEGSADSLNFFPQYWDVQALPEEQQHLLAKTPHKRELMYSSIMDYTQRFNSDFAGIGLYDKAAIKLGYGESVEVFDEREQYFVARDWIGSLYLLDPEEIPYVLGGPNANTQIEAEYNETVEEVEAGDELALLNIRGDTNINPQPLNMYRRRDIPMKDWLRSEVMRLYTGSIVADNASNTNLLRVNGLLDDDGRAPPIAVPFSFCSDAYAWGGNITCNRWDMGVTSREIVQNAGEMYEFYYPFNAFRGERVASTGGLLNGYFNRLYQRTYQPMLNSFRYFYFYRRSSARIFPTIRDWAEGSLRGMNFFARVLQTPDSGRYCNDGGNWVPELQASDCTESTQLDYSVARDYQTTWDNQYIFQPRNVGNFWDKYFAILAMTDSNAFFFRDFSSFVNRGAFNIGYYRVFQPEMLRLFGGLIAGDTSVHTPTLSFDVDGDPVVNYTPFLTTDIYGDPLPGGPPPGDPLLPSTSYRLRRWTANVGVVNLTSTFDQTMDFAARSRIAIAGSPTDPTYDPAIIDPATQLMTFTHPESLLEFRAARFDGAGSIGFNILSDAQQFVDGEYSEAEVELADAELNGTPEEVRAADVRMQAARGTLDEKVELIEFMIMLGSYFDFPG